jgi:hypothetical protein
MNTDSIIQLLNRIEKLDQLDILPQLVERLEKMEETVHERSMESYLQDIVPFKEGCKALGISIRHFYTLRAKGSISYVQFGNKKMFTRKQINDFLEAHTIRVRSGFTSS